MVLKGPESLDDAVGEGGGDELNAVGEVEPEEEVAVGGLLVVAARDDLLGAASEGLGLLLLDLELLAREIVGRGGPGLEAPFGLGLLAAVDEFKNPPSFTNRVYPMQENSNIK